LKFKRPRDRNEVLDRLTKVRPDSRPRWGSMSARQMVCHLSDSFRASLGEKHVSPSSTFLKLTLMKWAALWECVRTQDSKRQRLKSSRKKSISDAFW
jgi:hypothetical protein